MHLLDWLAISAYFLLMLVVGFVIRRRVHNARDFFTAGGKMPWWLAGISHHMSGYSSAVFVGYAALAYTEGFSLYLWWACTIVVSLLLGSFVFAPRWVRLRVRTGMISPLEYLAARYNVPTQMCLACSGSLLKIFDVGAKWTASALRTETHAQASWRETADSCAIDYELFFEGHPEAKEVKDLAEAEQESRDLLRPYVSR